MSGQGIPRLHLVTDDAVLHRPDFQSVATQILEAGGARLAFHLRGPASTGAHIYARARSLAGLAAGSGSHLLVNDRVDVALALDLGGVHLPRRGLAPEIARGLLGAEAVIGVSTHADHEVEEAARGAADYVFVGAVRETTSHPGQSARGLEAVRSAGAGGLPVVAIGGMRVVDVADAVRAGAHGVAVISGVWDDPHPRDAVIRYLDALACIPGVS